MKEALLKVEITCVPHRRQRNPARTQPYRTSRRSACHNGAPTAPQKALSGVKLAGDQQLQRGKSGSATFHGTDLFGLSPEDRSHEGCSFRSSIPWRFPRSNHGDFHARRRERQTQIFRPGTHGSRRLSQDDAPETRNRRARQQTRITIGQRRFLRAARKAERDFPDGSARTASGNSSTKQTADSTSTHCALSPPA